MERMVKVMIADSNPVFRQALRVVLAQRNDMDIIAEAGDGMNADRRIQETRPDLLIADLFLPAKNGLEVIRQAKARDPKIMILVMSIYESRDFVLEALAAGADGYCLKSASIYDLGEALDRVLAGKTFVPEWFSESSLENPPDSVKSLQEVIRKAKKKAN